MSRASYLILKGLFIIYVITTGKINIFFDILGCLQVVRQVNLLPQLQLTVTWPKATGQELMCEWNMALTLDRRTLSFLKSNLHVILFKFQKIFNISDGVRKEYKVLDVQCYIHSINFNMRCKTGLQHTNNGCRRESFEFDVKRSLF